MNKRVLDLLENVFSAEIDGAVNNGLGLFQTKSKLAKKLESEGYLVKDKIVFGGRFPVTCEGYRLTLMGNATYCMSERCTDEPPIPNVELTGSPALSASPVERNVGGGGS